MSHDEPAPDEGTRPAEQPVADGAAPDVPAPQADDAPVETPSELAPVETPSEPLPVADVDADDDEHVPGLFDDEDVVDDRPPRPHHVTAVLVAHDGERWLPAVLTALGRLTRRPDRLVAVDTGSTDGTPALLERAMADGLVQHVVTVPRSTGYGAAVAAGVDASSGVASATVPLDADAPAPEGPEVRWLWLLHDDSAPDPHALEALLRTSDRQRDVAVLGPKVRGWGNRAHLLEVGVTVGRNGNRVTGLERRELDQGQHDGDRDVLAVGSAGMLVRRDVWDALGGFDPALPFYREDVDLCWRARRSGERVLVATDAVVHHREAATHHRRDVDAGSPRHPERPERLDRASAIHLLRAHSRGARGPFLTVRLLVGSLLRALGLLLGKAPDAARDEWGAFRDAVRDRSGLAASRARVAAADASPSAVPDSEVRTWLAPRGAQLRHQVDRLGEVLAGRDADVQRSVLDSTNDDPDGWYDDDRRPSRLRRAIARPGTLVVLGLLVTALVGERALFGDGVLAGGALVPAPEGAGDLWQSYLTAWHEVGVGSAADAPAWLVPIAMLATLLRGSASVAVDVVLMLAVPLAGLTAWLALRGVPMSTPARVWAVVTYATLPAVTGALSGGRLGSAAALVLLPWLVRSFARLVGLGATGPVTWRRSAGTGLLLAVVASFAPVVWLVAAAVGLVVGVTVRRDRGSRLRLALAVLLPVAMLVPWSLRVVEEPGLLWLEPGLVGPVDRTLTPLDVLLLRPGGPGMTPLWLGLGIVVAGIAALGVPGRRRHALVAWGVGVVGLATAVLMTVLRVTVPAVAGEIAPWPGVPTAIWAGGLILAVAITVDSLPAQLAGRDFGWRQPTVVALAVLLLLAPIGAAGLLVLGADGPLRRTDREVLPAFVAAEVRGPERPRAIVLQRVAGGVVAYDLLSAPEPQLGDPDVAPAQETSAEVDRLVARLVAGIGATEVDDLADHGVRYVVLADAAPKNDPVVETLDSQRGLRRLSAREGDAVWELVPTAARVLTLATTTVNGVPVRAATAVPTTGGDPRTPTEVSSGVAAGAPGRELLVAEAADSRWRATVDGQVVALAPRMRGDQTDPSVQTVPLGAPAAQVAVSFDGSSRTAWLWVQGLVVAVCVVLALPSRRREDDDDGEDLEVDATPAADAAAAAAADADAPPAASEEVTA